MRERIVVGCSFQSPLENLDVFKGVDLAIVGGKAFPKVSYKTEIDGRTDVLSQIGNFSKALKVPLFVALRTDNYGIAKRSVAAFEKGRLLTIADGAHALEKDEAPSFGYKVIKTSIGKFGVAISKDVCDFDCLKALVFCESEAIINLYADFYDFSLEKLTPTLSYLTGVPIISVGESLCVSSTGGGSLVCNLREPCLKFTLPTKRRIMSVSKKISGMN